MTDLCFAALLQIVLGGSLVGKNSLAKSASELYSCKSAKEKRTIIVFEMGNVKYEVKLACYYDTGLTQDEQAVRLFFWRQNFLFVIKNRSS